MADPTQRITDIEIGLGETQESIAPNGSAYRITNFVQGPNGTLRSVHGPCPLVPNYGSGYPSDYGRMHGIYHCILHEGTRDVLLLHSGAKLLEFNGWYAGSLANVWRDLIGASGLLPRTLSNEDWAKWPTQFESDGKRVFIAMGMEMPIYCYDGFRVGELGYSVQPSTPSAAKVLIPSSTSDGGIGTFDPTYFTLGGILPYSASYYAQYRDVWGDISPVSGAGRIDIGGGADVGDVGYRISVAVDVGPDKTAARRLFRTPDLQQSTSIVPQEVYGGFQGSSEMFPDNITTITVDRTPDAYLGEPIMSDIRPIPRCSLLRIAMGRMWFGREHGDPGILYYSKPGMMGTVGRFDFLYPDPNGSGLTGLARCRDGLLAMTEGGTFLVFPSAAATDAFQSTPIPGGEVGCIAPSSVATMPNGMVVWLSRSGFVAFTGQSVVRISDPIRQTINRLDKGRMIKACAVVDPRSGEYRCAVSTGEDVTYNDLLLVWDGESWRERTDARPRAMCVTQDHRKLVLAAGLQSSDTATNGVWVLDHEGFRYTPATREAIYESRWMFPGGGQRESVTAVVLILREGSTGTGTLEMMRDGIRKVDSSTTFILGAGVSTTGGPGSSDAASAAWGSTAYDATGAVWSNRKVIFKRVDVHVPAAQQMAFRLRCTGDIEIVGYYFVSGNTRIPMVSSVSR